MNTFKKKAAPYLYLSPTIILMIVLMLIPIVMVISYSVMNNVIMNKNPIYIGLGNYKTILTDEVFHTTIYNTLFFTVGSVVMHMVIGLLFAMLLNSRLFSTATKSFFRVIYILPWVFTAAIIAILWRLLLNPNGIINYFLTQAGIIHTKVEWLGSRDTALYALTFINIWSGYPFYMISLLAGLQGISQDLYEAAEVDGANAYHQFISITIPQLKPIILSMAMLDCIWTMQQFPLVWMTTGGGPIHATEMLSTYTYKLAFSKYEFSLASASAVIILIFSMVLASVYVRRQKASV
ncbi:MAG TPA: sugar ABC transporter permease [Flexilinea sp.]|jgi:multiple sugar transport system permease protein|nr:sugar ABC transporter permease [Flexilinea sp.]HOG22299.1 sugar ABC transporter permease [Flexilinea sp.]HOP02181.1 sugar ABC transporter permease [Flexilinea sp.]HOR56534.1 sugar ABC transporter permease [Flexilinea sp.]HOU19982.1 sugar ABC transporter permease [Flexilinea sp.]